MSSPSIFQDFGGTPREIALFRVNTGILAYHNRLERNNELETHLHNCSVSRLSETVESGLALSASFSHSGYTGLAGAYVFCIVFVFRVVTSVARLFRDVFKLLGRTFLGVIGVLRSFGQVWPEPPACHLLGLSDPDKSERQDDHAYCYYESLPQFHVFHHSLVRTRRVQAYKHC